MVDFARHLGPMYRVLGVDATYTPQGGVPQALKLIFHESAPGGRLDRLKHPHEGPVANVRMSELPDQPASLDILAIGTRSFSVKKAERDIGGLAWIVELIEVFP